MRRIALWTVSTVVILVLLFTYHTSTAGPGTVHSAPALAGGNRPGIVSGPAPATGQRPATPAPAGPTPPAGQNTVVNGSVADTQWGPVQVQVTISGGRISKVVVLQQPDGNPRDREINSYAIPQLNQEVLTAQSAKIDAVSGATVT